MTRIKQRKNWQRAHMVCVRPGWRFVGAQHTRVLGVRWWCARVFKALARVFKHNLQYHINAALRAPPSALLCAEFIPRSKRFCRHLALSIFLRPVSHTIQLLVLAVLHFHPRSYFSRFLFLPPMRAARRCDRNGCAAARFCASPHFVFGHAKRKTQKQGSFCRRKSLSAAPIYMNFTQEA